LQNFNLKDTLKCVHLHFGFYWSMGLHFHDVHYGNEWENSSLNWEPFNEHFVEMAKSAISIRHCQSVSASVKSCKTWHISVQKGLVDGWFWWWLETRRISRRYIYMDLDAHSNWKPGHLWIQTEACPYAESALSVSSCES